MKPQLENKHCLFCDHPIKGRSDKKFCDDHCRNAYNNQRNATDSEVIRKINLILKRNRQILSSFLKGAKARKINRSTLLQKGFRFNYNTHIIGVDSTSTCIFCYDYGYLPLAGDWFLVIQNTGPFA